MNKLNFRKNYEKILKKEPNGKRYMNRKINCLKT